MKEFDYEQYRVVAFVKEIKGDKVTIDVIGYCDDLYTFYPLTEAEAVEMFPTRGRIFAFEFARDYKHFNGCIVCLWVEPSKSDGPERYVWSWKNGDVIEYGKRIFPLKGVFSDNGQQNYDVLRDNDLVEIEEDKLVYSAGKVYKISSDSSDRVVKYWEESSLEIVICNEVKCFIGFSLPKHDGLVDITTDEQLANWYLSKVVKKNWTNITQNQSFRFSESFLTEQLYSLKNLDEATLQSRLNRLKETHTKLSLTFESLKEIAETPWFGDVVARSVAEERVNILAQMEEENNSELNKAKEDYKTELLRLEKEQNEEVDALRQKVKKVIEELSEQELSLKEIQQEKNLEIELLNETVAEKKRVITALEESINSLNDRKESIIQDFSIIREVLNATGKSETQKRTETSRQFSLEEINFSDSPIKRFQAYAKSLENIMKENGAQNPEASKLGKMLANYNVLLCPNLSVAQSLIMASHRCKYITEYVSAKWSSFNDLWDNGLAHIVAQSIDEPDIMHFLLLQNINISYLPNFMQPLVDLQRRIITRFPSSEFPFPSNLRILCTVVVGDELMPMPEAVLKHFGCIDKSISFEPSHVMHFADDANLGYLTPTELSEVKEQAMEVQNMFEQYIDE